MFGIPNYLLAVAIFDTFVAIVVGRYYIKRRNTKEVVPTEQAKAKTFHRCQHCGARFEHPHKEIIYITTPPTVNLKCPKCGGTLRTPAKGECHVGYSNFEAPKVKEVIS